MFPYPKEVARLVFVDGNSYKDSVMLRKFKELQSGSMIEALLFREEEGGFAFRGVELMIGITFGHIHLIKLFLLLNFITTLI